MQDDIRVLSAMAVRQDNTMKAVIEEIHRLNQRLSVMHEQLNEQLSVINQRLSDIDNIKVRLSVIEGRVVGPLARRFALVPEVKMAAPGERL